MKKLKFFILSTILSFVLLFSAAPTLSVRSSAEGELKTRAKAALLYDARSKTVIYSHNEHKKLPIASMTKLASLMLVFDAIDEGKLELDKKVKISKNAADTEGSSAFLDAGSEYKISDLIMTTIVCSANDSTVALAEAVSGSEVAFVREMNSRASKLGLTDTNFVNCTGLPAVDHYSSAYDISIIYTTICDNPVYKKFSKIWMTELVHPSGRKTDIVNTNRLIKSFEGCDSGKTGFTNDAGYCLAASATRGGMRLVGAIIGADSSKERFNQMADMFEYGFNNFENKTVITSSKPITTALVKNSKLKSTELFVKEDFVKFLKRGEEFKYTLKYDEVTIKAPIKAGESVGKIYVMDQNNIVIFETELVTHEDIKAIKIGEILKKIYERI